MPVPDALLRRAWPDVPAGRNVDPIDARVWPSLLEDLRVGVTDPVYAGMSAGELSFTVLLYSTHAVYRLDNLNSAVTYSWVAQPSPEPVDIVKRWFPAGKRWLLAPPVVYAVDEALAWVCVLERERAALERAPGPTP